MSGFVPTDLLDLVGDLHAVIWEVDVATSRFTFVSEYAEALLGRPASEWVDLEFWAGLVHPDDRVAAVDYCRIQSAAGRDHDFVYRSVRPDGDLVWVRDVVRMVRDSSGHVTHMRGVMLDVTQQKNAEASMGRLAREQEALARISTAVAEDRPPEEVFAVIAEATASAIGCDVGAVVEFVDDDLALRGLWRVSGLAAGNRLPAPIVGIFRDVRRTGRAARLSPAEMAADDEVGRAVRSERIASAVIVPVSVGGRIWGCLAVAGRDGELASDTEARLEHLARSVGTGVSHADARARLVHQANTDSLTGLGNHRAFQERLREEVARAQRHGRSLSVVLIDLDGFKLVNDTYGHEMGDRALATIAARISRLARPGDMMARIGGDEFAWILAECDAMQGYAAAERARAAIAAEEWLPGVPGDASAGVCGLEEASDPDELMRLADGALYWAKSHGRAVTYRYTPAVVRALSATERAERLARQRTLGGLRALARAVDAKDHSTREHSERVADLAGMIAERLGIDDPVVIALREAALLHDVGKIGVPDAVLFKSDLLTDDEFEQVKAHAALGATIAAEVLAPTQVAWVRGHHERWSGGGYPDGLAGDSIPIGGRILALADAWDVMVNVRSYKAALSTGEALAECRRCSGEQFWPDAVTALEDLWRDGHLDGPCPSAERLTI